VKRIGLPAAVLLLAACPHTKDPTTTGTATGTGTTTGTGTATGTGTGTGTGDLHPAKVDVPWDKSGVAWDRIPEPGPEPTFTPPAPVELKLANGIRVLLVENHRLPLVSVRVVNGRAGSREDGAAAGLAALTGDLLDEGAGELTSITLPEELERLGADLDVAVGSDFAVVALDTLGETLEPSLKVLADVVMRPQLTDADFDRVKADVIEDLKQRPDSPRRVASLVFEKTIFAAHPYGAPTGGYIETVEKLTNAQAKKFWKQMYAPSAATIIVSGDVTKDALQALLDPTFGAWKGAKPPVAKTPAAPKAAKPQLVVVDRPNAPQSVVYLGRLGPTVKDPAYFPLEVVNLALGGSFASRLNHRLREELGYTYGISASYWRGAWAGSWTVASAFKSANTVEGIKEALAIIERTRSEELPADELAKAKQLLVRGQPQDFETNAGIAGTYESVVVTGRPLDWPATWADAVRKVEGPAAQKAVDAGWSGLVIVVVGDWKLLGDQLTALGLPVVHVDTEGKPVK
jgi:zinc protease